MKKVKYLAKGDKIREQGVVLMVLKNPIPLGKDSIYKVSCMKDDGKEAVFIVEGNIKLEVING